MADSPEQGADGVIRVSVSSEGTALPDSAKLLSLRVTRAVNRVPAACLEFVDGDMPSGTFPLSDAEQFKPGADIKIHAGYGGDEACIFEGIVIKHAVRITRNNDARLVVECRDKAIKMTVGRKNANHVDKSDSDIIRSLISAHSLTADVEASAVQHKELVQYYCSDWDFMLARAEANGLLVIATDGKVAVKAPAAHGTAPTLKVSYGEDLMAFEAEIDACTQYAGVQAVSWDTATQHAIAGTDEARAREPIAQGNLTSAALAEVLGPTSYRLQTAAPKTQAELTQWAKAQRLKSDLARIRGRMSFQGSAKAAVGAVIELAGVGSRFSGKVFVSGLTHSISDGNWVTDVEFGLAPPWSTEQHDVTAPGAAGLLPAVEGLQIGVVMKLDGDPDGEHRVQVSVPVMQAETDGVWARVLQFHGSSGFGAFFVPEVGDEVVLGYFNQDPSHPVILGSLYSSKRAPAYVPDAQNNTKAIVTRCKSKIEFNEADQSIAVTTPGNNKVVLSDAGQSIVLHDQNDNRVELNAGGITLRSPKDITLVAGGKISLDAIGAVGIAAKADVTVAGLNVSSDAQVGFSAKGTASAELSAAGQTVVKGAMVMIN
jgi:Rhs element Vgr protein